MKVVLLIFSTLCFFKSVNGQGNQDSVNVRILNKGKYYIKEYVLTIGGKDYKFTDVWENKYSDYQHLPYLWPSNHSKITVIVKRMFKYDQWLNLSVWPIDHVGEKQMIKGSYTIEIRTKEKAGKLSIEDVVLVN